MLCMPSQDLPVSRVELKAACTACPTGLTGLSPQYVLDITRKLGHERPGNYPSVWKPSALHGNERVSLLPIANVGDSDNWATAHPANVFQIVTANNSGHELLGVRPCKFRWWFTAIQNKQFRLGTNRDKVAITLRARDYVRRFCGQTDHEKLIEAIQIWATPKLPWKWSCRL